MKQKWLNNKYGDFSFGYDISIMITNKCNLQCRGCKNLTQADNNWEISTHDFEQSLKYLKQNFPSVRTITLTGGEPLTHSKFHELYKIFYTIFPNKVLDILTNGILINHTFINDLSNKKNIHFSISDYSLADNINNYEQYTDEINLDISLKRNVFEMPQFLLQSDKTLNRQYLNCSWFSIPCFFLKENILYLCPITANINNLKEFSNLELVVNKDYLNIAFQSEKDLYGLCTSDKTVCCFCNQKNNALLNTIPWTNYRDPLEYFYNLKDYFIFDYYSYLKIINNYLKLYNEGIYNFDEELNQQYTLFFEYFLNSKYIEILTINSIDNYNMIKKDNNFIKQKNFYYIIFNRNLSNEEIEQIYMNLLDENIKFLAFKDYNLDINLWKPKNIEFINYDCNHRDDNFLLVILTDNSKEYIYDLKKYNIDNIHYGTNLSKKINITTKLINNKQPELNNLYDSIKQDIKQESINKITIHYNNFQEISFLGEIKDIVYFIDMYSGQGDICPIEELQFIFLNNDNQFNNEYCSNNCPYLDKEFCKKYKKVLYFNQRCKSCIISNSK